jgi:hypothetical protein
MRMLILQEIEARKDFFLNLDITLAEKLPSLQKEVAEKMEQSESRLAHLQAEIEGETQSICKQIKEAQNKQVTSFE